MKPTLFFSHSSDDDLLCQPLLQALEGSHGLCLGYDARDLKPGGDWRRQLMDWLRRCQAGVVLVTPAVLARPGWVLQEATLMAFRAAGEGEAFRLYVIADDAVRADPRYQASFGALAFDRLQQLRPEPGVDWAADAPRLAQAIAADMAKVVAFHDDYFARLAERLYDDLEGVTALHQGRRLIDETYPEHGGQVHALTDPPTMLALLAAFRLAHADFGQRVDIRGLFQRLALVCGRSLRQSLLGKLKSWWVVPANGERVCRARAGRYSRRLPPANLVLMPIASGDGLSAVPGAKASDVVYHHVHRGLVAYSLPSMPLLSLAAPETARETVAAIADALRGEDYFWDARAGLRQVLRYLAKDQRDGMAPVHVHLHLSAAQADHALVAARVFWPCTFVLTAAPEHTAPLAAALGLSPVEAPAHAPRYGDGLRLSGLAAKTDRLPEALP